MINTNELRLGNIILYNKRPVVVKGIFENVVELDGIGRVLSDDQGLEPIMLSNTLFDLINVGRKPDSYGMSRTYHGGLFVIRGDENDGYFISMTVGDSEPIHITPCLIRCFHQLQNIHFAQYGCEISIREQQVIMAWQTIQNFKKV